MILEGGRIEVGIFMLVPYLVYMIHFGYESYKGSFW